MKKNIIALITFCTLTFMSSNISAQYVVDKMDLSVFPKPEKGYQKFVIEVPHSSIEDDGNKKIEFFVGKNVQVDKCNNQFLAGDLVEKDLKGFGYQYYDFKTTGNVATTLMGCGETGTISKFVTAKPVVKNYNGRMPIVVYAPEGYDVRFKIYKAEPETYRAAQINTKK